MPGKFGAMASPLLKYLDKSHYDVSLTPEEFRQRTHQKHHSFGGVPPVIGNKPPAHKTPIEGLWFIGAQSESTGGILNVMAGAQKVAKQILQEA